MSLFFLFLLGLCVGSFLNVLADRLPKGENVFWGRSYCDHCRQKLKALDLVPVFSFLFLKGKCRFCDRRISLKYPLVELVTGLGFAYLYSQSASFFLFCLFAVLLVIFLTDLQYLIIPDSLVVLGGLFIFAYRLFSSPSDLFPTLLVGLMSFLFFYLIFWLTQGRGMGFGDVKFAFLMGFLLGFPSVVFAFYLAFLTGALVGLILLLSKKINFGKVIPFGPFLVVATIVVYLWQDFFTWLVLKILF